jgi:hypothetical protein
MKKAECLPEWAQQRDLVPTSMIQGSAEEPPVDSHSASGSRSRKDLPQVKSRVVILHRVLMFSILLVSARCESWDASAPCP